MRWLKKQVRVVLPTGSAAFKLIALLACIYVGGETVSLALRFRSESGLSIISVVTSINDRAMTVAVIASAAVVIYTVYRVCACHPVLTINSDYRRWLALTPYQKGKPLPVGPVTPVWQDLLILGPIFAAAAWRATNHLWVVAAAFLVAYLLATLLVFLSGGAHGNAYVNLFAITVAILCYYAPSFGFAFLIAAFLNSWRALPRVADQCVEPDFQTKGIASDIGEIMRRDTKGEGEESSAPYLGLLSDHGLPYATLSPKRFGRKVYVLDALCFSVWCGLVYFTILFHTVGSIFADSSLQGFCLLVVVLAAVFRLYIYLPGHRAPISLLGRIATGNLIIPGFDKVFVAPIAAVFLAFSISFLLPVPVWALIYTESIAVSAGLLCLYLIGPRYGQWATTGPRRLAQTASNTNQLTKA